MRFIAITLAVMLAFTSGAMADTSKNEAIEKSKAMIKELATTLQASLKEAVKEVLKEMPPTKEKVVEEVKYFDFKSGKFVNSKGITASQEALCNLLRATSQKDEASAMAINKEIAQLQFYLAV